MLGLLAWPHDGVAASVVWMALAMLAALWVDRVWGEPRLALHPVVWMGRYLQWAGSLATRCQPAAAFASGALAWCAGACAVGAAAWALQALALDFVFQSLALLQPGVGALAGLLSLLTAWVLKGMLSWRMLRDEVGAVEQALGQSLAAGRERLGWLVSRDTAELSETEVRESAIESLAENLNDSVVAPIFWFVLLGLPGAAVYRFANTADAMWGYKGLRGGLDWEWAGKWAARADDVLSWLPARITALLLTAQGRLRLSALRVEARKTPSPNSGWPMAAMALLLGIRLGKPGVYALNPAGRSPQAPDTALAQKYASNVLVALVNIALAAMVLIAIWSLT